VSQPVIHVYPGLRVHQKTPSRTPSDGATRDVVMTLRDLV